MRAIAGLILLLAAATATAIPVTVAGIYTEWKLDNYTATSPADVRIGDAYYFDSPPSAESIYRSESTAGASYSRAYASRQTTTSGDDDSLSYDVLLRTAIDVSADAGLTDPYAGAMAAAYANRFIVWFDVLEPVRYSGTLGLAEGFPDYDPGITPITAFSGSILNPGRYFTTNALDHHYTALSARAQPGESIALSASALYQFDFVSIPAPATVALVVFGLAGIAMARRRRAD